MREILFRGKRPRDGKWLFGTPVKSITECYDECVEIIEKIVYETGLEISTYADGERVIPETIGEYTGMADKNGKKIFEGDIVKLDEYVKKAFDVEDGEVKFGRGGFYIGDFNMLNSLNTLASYDGILRGEVIGNIYDNPEMVEG